MHFNDSIRGVGGLDKTPAYLSKSLPDEQVPREDVKLPQVVDADQIPLVLLALFGSIDPVEGAVEDKVAAEG